MMKHRIYTLLIIVGIFMSHQLIFAQVDFNKRPDDDLGNVEDEYQELFFEALTKRNRKLSTCSRCPFKMYQFKQYRSRFVLRIGQEL